MGLRGRRRDEQGADQRPLARNGPAGRGLSGGRLRYPLRLD